MFLCWMSSSSWTYHLSVCSCGVIYRGHKWCWSSRSSLISLHSCGIGQQRFSRDLRKLQVQLHNSIIQTTLSPHLQLSSLQWDIPSSHLCLHAGFSRCVRDDNGHGKDAQQSFRSLKRIPDPGQFPLLFKKNVTCVHRLLLDWEMARQDKFQIQPGQTF